MSRTADLQEITFKAFGSDATLLVVTDDSREFRNLSSDVERILLDVDRRFSPDDPHSELSRLRTGSVDENEVSDDMQRVLDGCRIAEAMTDGAFRPRTAEGDLDPAGFVKGWAMKRAGSALSQRGLTDWCLTVGGDVLTSGRRGDRDWQVAIGRPGESGVAVILGLSGHAVATSGARVDAFGGVGQGHIWQLGSRTAEGSGSMTVIGPSMDIADAMATGAVAMGDDAFDIFSRLPDYHLLKLEGDQMLVSDGFPFLTQAPTP